MEDLWKVCMSSAHNFLSLNSPEAFRLDTPYHIRYSKKLEDVLRPLHPVGLQIDQERIAAAKLGQAGCSGPSAAKLWSSSLLRAIVPV